MKVKLLSSGAIRAGLRRCLWMAAWFFFVAPTVQAQISVIVARSSAHTATQAQVRDYFSGAKLHWSSGARVLVVDRPKTEIGEAFYKKLVGRSPAQVRVQWTKLVLSGQAPPPIKGMSEEEVKKLVSENPNAIGFIATSALDDTVEELIRIE